MESYFCSAPNVGDKNKQMKQSVLTFFTIIYFFTLSGTSVAQFAPQIEKVIVEGQSDIENDNRSTARKKAIIDAMNNSFKEVLYGTVIRDVIDANTNEIEKLLLKSEDYVQSYKVMTEYLDILANSYYVVLEVSIFKGELKKALAGKQLLFKGRHVETVVVLIDERNAGEADNYSEFLNAKSTVEDIIKKTIEDKKLTALNRKDISENINQDTIFQALNGSIKAVTDIGIRNNAEVVIIGSAISRAGKINDLGEQIIPMKTTLKTKAIRCDKGVVMSMLSNYAEVEKTEDEGKNILQETSEKMANDLITKIVEKWKD